MAHVRILLADDHTMVRRGLRLVPVQRQCGPGRDLSDFVRRRTGRFDAEDGKTRADS